MNGAFKHYIDIKELIEVSQNYQGETYEEYLYDSVPANIHYKTDGDSMSAQAKALEVDIEYVIILNGWFDVQGSLENYRIYFTDIFGEKTLKLILYPIVRKNYTELHCVQSEDEDYSKDESTSMGAW